MSSLFTRNFGIFNARAFEYYVAAALTNLYIGIGRQYAWANGDTVPTPVESSNNYYATWNDLIALKKITAADMNLVVPRVDWANGTTYVEYTQDLNLFYKANTANIAYDNKFYVRNTKDQVFKCLFNNSNASSTIMPEIDVGGQLPENPYVETSDGYRWKYLYKIPSGLKEKFFTTDYMPVVVEENITNSARNGRIDILKIITQGAGFNANVSNNFLNIISIKGDGEDANLRVNVQTTGANGGNIVGYTIISGGNNYTRATVSIIDSNKIANTANANLIAIIGPPGGHGSNVSSEIGASSLMISTAIEGDENGIIPTKTGGENRYRQVTIFKDPKILNGTTATASVYRATTKYFLAVPTGIFAHRETVYSGSSLAAANLTAIVEHYDPANTQIFVNNVINDGTVNVTSTFSIVGANSGATATVIVAEPTELKPYTGELLYTQNSSEVTRDPTEYQQFKIVLRF
jgi:hypothetical protein